MFDFTKLMLFLNAVTLSPNCNAMQVNDIKPGHDIVKEFHMHPYWFQTNMEQVNG